MHVPKQQKAKLDLKVIECIFLGFGDNKFGYRLWDPENKKLIWNKDVVFKEDQTFGDFESKKKDLKNMYVEALKKEMNHLPQFEKKKRPELINHFFHLVMMGKIWMSFFMVLLMILFMMMNRVKKI